MLDHSVLQPAHTEADLKAACAMSARLGVASVCMKPSMVSNGAEWLAGSGVAAGTVIGFPHGGTSTGAKVRETELACQAGATEVDMVVNLGQVLAEDWEPVLADIRAVIDAAAAHQALTKVIFETGLLPNDSLKKRLCELSEEAGAAFVKTSTGFGHVKREDGALVATGATDHDIRLMRASCSDQVAVKASGGIRSYADAQRLVALGATRLGTSSTEAIAAGEQENLAGCKES